MTLVCAFSVATLYGAWGFPYDILGFELLVAVSIFSSSILQTGLYISQALLLIKASSSSSNSKVTFRFNFYYIMIYCIHLEDNEVVIAFINVAFETEQFNYMESPSMTFA